MGGRRANNRAIGVARRGQIIQRILVDGWTVGEAASVFEVGERQVARWVAAYRRDGMASLRDGLPGASGHASRLARLWTMLVHNLTGARERLRRPEPATCVELRRRGEDGHNL